MTSKWDSSQIWPYCIQDSGDLPVAIILPDTWEEPQQQTCEDTAVVRNILGPRISGPCLSEIHLSELHFLVGWSPVVIAISCSSDMATDTECLLLSLYGVFVQIFYSFCLFLIYCDSCLCILCSNIVSLTSVWDIFSLYFDKPKFIVVAKNV